MRGGTRLGSHPSLPRRPPTTMLVDRLLRDSARRAPDVVALIEPSSSITYAELDALADGFARACRAAGVARGDRVVIASDNCSEFVAAYFGAMRAGGVAVPLPSGVRNDRFGKAVADCAPALCIVDGATAADETCAAALGGVPTVLVLPSLRPRPGRIGLGAMEAIAAAGTGPSDVRHIDQDLAAIIYTSGSTGEPRGVMLTHRNIVTNTRSIVRYLRLTADDRVMCVLPFSYVYGLSLVHTHVAVGGSVVIENRFAYPTVVVKAMCDRSVTGFAGVPSTFSVLLSRPDFSGAGLPAGLRYVTQAGGAMAPARIDEWIARVPGVPFFVMYGATEASARLTYLEPSEIAHRGSIGRAVPNVEIAVVAEDGSIAGPGEPGELVARGSNISCGYWKDPAETALRFAAGGYRTGDLGYRAEDGLLYLIGRRHDMIKSGAHRVGPKEIEDVLHRHPQVLESAVVGESHDLLGEVPVAFVVLRNAEPVTVDALRAFCARSLAPYKVPARFEFRDALPKTPGVGKIDKRTLRTWLAAGATSAPGRGPGMG